MSIQIDFKLLQDKRLDYKIYNTEYAYIVPFVTSVSQRLMMNIEQILEFRQLDEETFVSMLEQMSIHM